VIDPLLFFFSILLFLGLPLSFYFIAKYKQNMAFFSLIILWPLFEFLEARYTALPNFVTEIGTALGSSPFLGLARWGGLTGLTIFCVIINLAFFWLFKEILKKENKNKTIILILASLSLVVLFLGLAISKILLKQNSQDYQALSHNRKVALVSDNGQLDEIFKKEKLNNYQLRKASMAFGEALTGRLKELKISSDFDLVVLPEALMDVNYDETEDQEALSKFKVENDGILIETYRSLAIGLKVDLIANVFSRQEGKLYNTLLFFNARGEMTDIFNKETLTITGEYWPFGRWRPFYFNWLLNSNLNKEYYREREDAIFNPANNLSRGESKIVSLGGMNLAPAICLEIHYPAKIKKRVNMGADVIINTSSSVWINTGLKKYLALTDNLKKIEAVWLKKPILSTGRRENATIITPDGKEAGIIFNAFDSKNSTFITEVKFYDFSNLTKVNFSSMLY
jgi:apolipoprotein N-acyltransferase